MTTRWFEHDGGRLAYSDEGTGPLVICVPGIGDLRDEYRFLVPRLVDAGFRVVGMDLRGHGESSVGWRDVSAEATGSDMLALIRHLDADRALVIGTSKAGGSAVWAAAEAPDAVAGAVLIGPFVRDTLTAVQRRLYPALFRVMFAGPWGVPAWMRFWGGLFASTKPADFDAYAARLRANLSEPGRLAALRTMMTALSGPELEARLEDVTVPSLVVMGSADSDFPDATAEATMIAERLHGELAMIDGAGHYPHVECAEPTADAIVAFARRVMGEADSSAA